MDNLALLQKLRLADEGPGYEDEPRPLTMHERILLKALFEPANQKDESEAPQTSLDSVQQKRQRCNSGYWYCINPDRRFFIPRQERMAEVARPRDLEVGRYATFTNRIICSCLFL